MLWQQLTYTTLKGADPMSIQETVIAIYGWKLPTSDAISKWADELDYKLPDGINFIGMDGEEVSVGIKLFNSGSSRRKLMSGSDVSFDHDDMNEFLESWQRITSDAFEELFYNEIGDIAPQYHIFIDCS
jgi:hypothetical protein